MTLNDLTISPSGINMDTLLDDWKWLLNEPMKPVMITALGDVFTQTNSGKIYFLDTVSGAISVVADDGLSFKKLLSDSEFVTSKMFPSTILDLRNNGLKLNAKQVYSHIKPLVLGGEDSINNYEVTDVEVHLSLTGQIHEKVLNIPDGAEIGSFDID